MPKMRPTTRQNSKGTDFMAIRTIPMIPTPLERAAGRFMRAPDHEEADDGLDNEGEGADDDDQSGQSGDDEDHQDGETDGSEPDDDEDSDDKPNRRDSGWKKRVDRLTRRAKEAEAEIARLRGEKGEPKPKTESKPEGKPKLENFDNYEDWVEALTDYKADQRINASKAETEKAKAETDFLKRFNAGRKSFKDWDDVVTNDVDITAAMQNAIKESDIPAEIIYWLGQNPDEAERIFDLPAGKQALAIGKIEAKLEGKKSDRSGNNERRSSNAPEPIKPTTSSGKKISKSYDDMSYGEFVAQRRADARRAQGIRT
jgi:hypothetical protein